MISKIKQEKKLPTKKTIRNIPILNYKVVEVEDYYRLSDSNDYKKFVFHNLVLAIAFGLQNNSKTADLFKLRNSGNVILIKKEHWKEQLINAINFYSEIDLYNECIDCENLIKIIDGKI